MLMVDENSSLVQAFECLKSSIIEAFAALDCDLTQTCVAEGSVRIHGKTAVNIASIEQSEAPENSDKIYGHILWTTPPYLDKAKVLFVEFDPDRVTLKGLAFKGGLFNGTEFNLIKESFYTSDTISMQQHTLYNTKVKHFNLTLFIIVE